MGDTAARDGIAHAALLIAVGVVVFGGNQAVGVSIPITIASIPGGNAADVGLVAACGTAGGIVGRLVARSLVQRFPLARLARFAVAALAAVLLVYRVVSSDVAGLVVVRTVHGLCFAVASTVLYISIAAVAHERKPSGAIGMANMSMPLAGMFAPLLAIEWFGGSIAVTGPVFAALSALSIGVIVSRGNGLGNQAPLRTSRQTTSGGPSGRLVLPFLASGLLGALDAVSMDYLPLVGAQRELGGFGWLFTVLSASFVLTLVVISGGLRRISTGSLAVWGGLCMTVGAIGWPWISTLLPFAITIAVFGIGYGLSQTSINSIAAQTDPQNRPRTLASVLLAFDIGRTLSVYVIGVGITYYGYVMTFVPVVLLFGFVLVLLGARRSRANRVRGTRW